MNVSVAPDTNRPDYAQEVFDRLSRDYAQLLESVADVIARGKLLPTPITSDDQLSEYGGVIADGRALVKRLTTYHQAEKDPYLNGGRGCDNLFFGEIDKLARRFKSSVPGIIDIADKHVDDWMQAKLREERARRLKAELEERNKLLEAAQKAEAERLAAQAAFAAAERARKLENIAARQKEAEEHAEAAAKATAEEKLAAERAADAHIDTLATAADMTRTRLDSGHVATMVQIPYVEIIDVMKLDRDALWPHLKEDAILSALKSWAKTKSHKIPMSGAIIEMRDKGQLR